ncbi:MAG: hypothetical protein HC822_10710 [Oscillochloris sp.]|nr:hypothetical protein [Oscillochloris sp.]
MDRLVSNKPVAAARTSAGVRSSALGLAALVFVTVAAALLTGFAAILQPPLRLTVAAERFTGPIFTSGIYARETNPAGYNYRWTSGSALIQVRGAFFAAPAYIAEMRLRSEHPAGPQAIRFRVDDRELATATPATVFRTYRLLLPADPAGDGELRLNLQTTPFVAPGNPRQLGVQLTELSLHPVSRPNWPAAILVGLGLPLLYLLQRRRTSTSGAAILSIGLSGLTLAGLAALYRPTALPLPILVGLALLALSAACFVQRNGLRLGLSALCLIVAFAGMIWPAWLSDDAFISFRYAQNLVAGNGLVYNTGERVEGYTNFLWTLLSAGVIALGGDVALWSHIAGTILGLALVLLTYRQATYLLPAPWPLVAALVAGTSQSLLLYTARGSGLETGLFALLLLLGAMVYLNADGRVGSLAGAGAIFALAALTRPEGVMVSGLTGLHLLATLWMHTGRVSGGAKFKPIAVAALAFGGAFLLIFGPYFLWRFTFYGDLLPNTFYAKTGGGLRQVLRGLQYTGDFALTLGGPLLLLIGVPWLRDHRAALGSWRGYMLPLVLIYSAYIIAVGGDHFRGERFFVPLLPWIAILLADGIRSGGEYLVARGIRANFRRITLAALLILGAFGALARTDNQAETIRGLDESVWIWREIGWWVADHGAPDASIAASGAGAVAYYSRNTTIDLLGLTDKHIGRLEIADMGTGIAGHEKRDPEYVLNERRPTYIPRIWDDYFGGPAVLRAQYELVPIVTRSGRELEMWVRR